MEVGSSQGKPSSVVRPLKHSGGGVTCTHDPVGEEWSEWAIRWPPRESRWEVHVRVPRKPKAAVLQIPTPHLALAGVMAANNGEWRNKFGPFQSATQAFHDCFATLFPISTTNEKSFVAAVSALEQSCTVNPGDRVQILPASGPLPQRDKTRQAAQAAVREVMAKLQASIAEQCAFAGTLSGTLRVWRSATLQKRVEGAARRKRHKVSGVALSGVSESVLKAAVADQVYVKGRAPSRVPLHLVTVFGRPRAIALAAESHGTRPRVPCQDRGGACQAVQAGRDRTVTALVERVGHSEDEEKTLSREEQLTVIRYRLSAARDATALTLVGVAAKKTEKTQESLGKARGRKNQGVGSCSCE